MEDKKILLFFKKAKRKIICNLLLDNLIIFTVIGLLVGIAIHVAALFVPIYGSLNWAILAVGVAVAAGIFYTIFTRPGNQKIALLIDSKGLDEQLITSMELEGKEDIISSLQKQKTVDAISEYSIKEKLPYRWSFTNILLLAFSLIAFVLAAVMPSDAKTQATALHEMKKVVEEEKEKLEEAEREVSQLDEISDSQLEELKKLLEESREELEEAEKERDLQKAKERLETKLETELEKEEDELKQKVSEILEKKDIIQRTQEQKDLEEQERELKKQLEALQQQLAQSQEQENQSDKNQNENNNNQNENNRDNQNGNNSDNQNGNNSDNQNGNNSDNQNGNDGDNQNEASGNQGGGNNASELMEMSQQVQQAAGNGMLTGEQMQQLAQNIAQASGNLSEQQMQDLSSQMSQMLQQSSNANASVSEQATASMGGNSPSGGGNNTSEGNGQSGSGQGEGASGTGGSQSGSGQSGSGYSTGSKTGVEREYVRNTSEEVTIPENVGDDENLTGQSSGNGESYTQRSQNGLAWAGNSVNYSQVVGDYANQAYSDVENNKVPDSMKEVVKSYFAGLTK